VKKPLHPLSGLLVCPCTPEGACECTHSAPEELVRDLKVLGRGVNPAEGDCTVPAKKKAAKKTTKKK
jgi:hypothetical protein